MPMEQQHDMSNCYLYTYVRSLKALKYENPLLDIVYKDGSFLFVFHSLSVCLNHFMQ